MKDVLVWHTCYVWYALNLQYDKSTFNQYVFSALSIFHVCYGCRTCIDYLGKISFLIRAQESEGQLGGTDADRINSSGDQNRLFFSCTVLKSSSPTANDLESFHGPLPSVQFTIQFLPCNSFFLQDRKVIQCRGLASQPVLRRAGLEVVFQAMILLFCCPVRIEMMYFLQQSF